MNYEQMSKEALLQAHLKLIESIKTEHAVQVGAWDMAGSSGSLDDMLEEIATATYGLAIIHRICEGGGLDPATFID